MSTSNVTNKNLVFKPLGASNHSNREREINDFYATPPSATLALLNYCAHHDIILSDKTILEPCCGKGHISNICSEYGYNVDNRDLIDRGCGAKIEDFFTNNEHDVDMHIITNPPYKLAQEFVEHAMKMIKNDNYICMLLKITFLEGIKRQEMFNKYPPYKLLVFSDRINCSLGGDFEKDSQYGGAIGYAWYIWKVGFNGKTTVDWINSFKFNSDKSNNALF